MAQPTPSTISSLPPPPSTSVAPGQRPSFDQGHSNGSHMPPPLSIPQNGNGLPQAIPAGASGLMSPTGGAGTVRRAAPEPNKRALYVGGLDLRVTEDVLKQIFETTGHVQNVKIIPDKNAKGYNYGFVEYDDPAAAERAMQSLNGRRIHTNEIRVNWAYQASTITKEDTSGHFHIFVGDLSNEVNDEVLTQAFSTFGVVSEARVMWDMKTGRSRGYGFVAFKDRSDAEKALSSMDGEWLGSRAIRCNWANQKGQPSFSQQNSMGSMTGSLSSTPASIFPPQQQQHHQFPSQGAQSYEMIVQQTPSWQTTCYVGNLTPYTTQNDLVPLFSNFGYVMETRFQSDRGFAFIKMDSHEAAAMAICQLNGYGVNGRPLKCSWGKDRPPTGQFDYSPAASHGSNSAFPGTPSGYGMPASYPQYGAPGMSPAAPSPGAHFGGGGPGAGGFPPPQQHHNQQPQQHYAGMAPSPGAYGRSHVAGGYMGQPQATGYGGYPGYQG